MAIAKRDIAYLVDKKFLIDSFNFRKTEGIAMLDINKSDIAAENHPARGRAPFASVRRKRVAASESPHRGLAVNLMLATKDKHPFDDIEWELRTASITDDKGKVIFLQENVEVPKSWSMLATNIVASKYFYGGQKTNLREHSVRQLVHRVARAIADWGMADGYFATPDDAENYYKELCCACVKQLGSFNSPVWFNVGLHQQYGVSSDTRTSYHWNAKSGRVEPLHDSYKHPQASACFIQAVKDTMEDIMRLASTEAMLFKYGSGTGTDLSTLRSSREKLSGGGTPSGPLSFMRVFDQVAAVIKSGGKTRRAAKMQSLRIDHPDIIDFITAKTKEEKKAWSLINEGYDGSFGGEAYSSIMFQNSNFSVRVVDEFMQAVQNDGNWQTHAITTGQVVDTYNARDLLRLIAEGTYACGDPGVQYDSTINRWNTCINSGRINASNPCSEYMFIDDSACNLASINLLRFVDDSGAFEMQRLQHVVRLFIVAQDILVDNASYPTEDIAANSHLFRPLGLGYANLGAMLMYLGLPYDSDEGRALAGVVTALLTGYAYETSAEIAGLKGAFTEYAKNQECMLKVIRLHQEALDQIATSPVTEPLHAAAEETWERVVRTGTAHGFRNAQATLLAPTGTIGFMMDCDTTGIEPDIALVKFKQLAGGGEMKIVNQTVGHGLKRLGYPPREVECIQNYINEKNTIEGAPGLKQEHLAVFDCAFKPKEGKRFIPYRAHLQMMASVQPFLSGAISKTINMPREATVEEIMQAYADGWRMGLKAVAIYRDGSKRTQPLSTSRESGDRKAEGAAGVSVPRVLRKRMPATRKSITHKFEVAGHEGYLTVGLYEDGRPGELFITMAKEGSTVGGIMDAFGTAISLCLQYGVPLRELIRKFSHSRFEPSGFTKNPDIPMAKSLVDYIFRWMELTFPEGVASSAVGAAAAAAAPPRSATAPTPAPTPAEGRLHDQFKYINEDAPVCDVCGAITTRNGACYRCNVCGNSMGCS
jgi:ribonucleoside-diphosphate reductase alpha chain